MKQFLFIACAGLLLVCTSCNDSTPVAGNTNYEQEQKNIAAFNVVTNAFSSGDPAGIDSVVADDFIDHTDKGDLKGKDSLKAMIISMHDSFKDMKTESINTAANGDYVYGWRRYTGTSDGSMGMPKGPYDMQTIELVKFANGKAVEHWAFMEMQDMMEMMPPPGGMDSTKMK